MRTKKPTLESVGLKGVDGVKPSAVDSGWIRSGIRGFNRLDADELAALREVEGDVRAGAGVRERLCQVVRALHLDLEGRRAGAVQFQSLPVKPQIRDRRLRLQTPA